MKSLILFVLSFVLFCSCENSSSHSEQKDLGMISSHYPGTVQIISLEDYAGRCDAKLCDGTLIYAICNQQSVIVESDGHRMQCERTERRYVMRHIKTTRKTLFPFLNEAVYYTLFDSEEGGNFSVFTEEERRIVRAWYFDNDRYVLADKARELYFARAKHDNLESFIKEYGPDFADLKEYEALKVQIKNLETTYRYIDYEQQAALLVRKAWNVAPGIVGQVMERLATANGTLVYSANGPKPPRVLGDQGFSNADAKVLSAVSRQGRME